MTVQTYSVPKGERVWCTYHDLAGKTRFLITSKEANLDFYFLYEVDGAKLRKLGKSRSPKDLEVKHMILEHIKEGSA